MKKIFTILIALCALSASAQSKKIKLTAVPLQLTEFPFNKVTVVDSRLDTNVVGWVTKGIDNILVPAVFDEPASSKLNNFYKTSTEQLWEKGRYELVIHVTDLFLMEDPEMIGTVGNMDIRMQAFVKSGDRYYSIRKFDRQEPFTAYDVTQKMFRTLNSYLTEFIQNVATTFTEEMLQQPGYTWDAVLAIRQQELMQLYPVYRNERLLDGIYETSNDFLQQTPTAPVTLLEQQINQNLAKPKRKRQRIFAYVKDGTLFFFQNTSKYETIELYKRDQNFFKQDYGLDPQLQASSAALGWAFGLLAEAIASDASNGNRSWYEFIYNPRNGLFYHYKKLANTKEQYQASLNQQ